jgi:hypothetical protein
VTASPAPSSGSGRPPRDQRLQPYLQSQAMWGVVQTLVGIRHAAEDTDPRPLPQTPLSEFKRRCAAGAPSGGGLRDDSGKVRRTLLRDERVAWLNENRAFRIFPARPRANPADEK